MYLELSYDTGGMISYSYYSSSTAVPTTDSVQNTQSFDPPQRSLTISLFSKTNRQLSPKILHSSRSARRLHRENRRRTALSDIADLPARCSWFSAIFLVVRATRPFGFSICCLGLADSSFRGRRSKRGQQGRAHHTRTRFVA